MSRFQQRHYEAIAEVLQEVRDRLARQYVNLPEDDWDVSNSRSSADAAINLVEFFLIESFSRDNYLFQPERFRKACVPGANVRARS